MTQVNTQLNTPSGQNKVAAPGTKPQESAPDMKHTSAEEKAQAEKSLPPQANTNAKL
ncbi:MAG: hypothetical protein WBK91_07040 [Alphaproteobacteria bacterium]